MKNNYLHIKIISEKSKKKNKFFSTNIFSFSTLFFLLLTLASTSLYSSWERMESIPYPYNTLYYLDVYILPTNPDSVWVCGRSGAIIRSTDGGKSWRGFQIRDKFVPDLQLEKIHFVNSKFGFTSGSNRIYKTTDGGITWGDISDNRSTAIWGHWFFDEKNGIQVGGGCVDKQQFFRTTDGGLTWNLFENNVFESGLTHVQMMSKDGLAYTVSSGNLWQSDNGGYNWYLKAKTGNYDWQEQLAVNGNTFLFPFSTGCTGGGPGGARFSIDGGKTWKEFYINKACFGSYLLSPLEGWFCGVDRSVLHTTNGGESWEEDFCGIPIGSDLDDIKFYNDTLGYVVGQGVYKYRNYDKEKPVIQGNFPLYLCEPDSVILRTSQKYKNYLWSNGAKTETILVNKTGKYSVKVWNNDCDAGQSSEVSVIISQKPQPLIISDNGNSFCEGDTINLYLKNRYPLIKWNNNSSDSVIRIFKSGKYSVEVVDSNGCKGNSEIIITMNPKPQITINKLIRSTFCVGDSLFLTANTTDGEITWYKDNINTIFNNSKTIWIKESGNYFVKITNKNNCFNFSDTVSITFKKDTNKIVFEFLSSDNTINFGDSRNESVIKVLKINNNGFADFLMNDILIFKNTAFSIPQSQLPVNIPAKGFVLINVIFNPDKIGKEIDTLLFEDVCSNHILNLVGNGINDEYFGVGKCSTDLQLITSEYGDGTTISIGKPFPNPSIDEIKIPLSFEDKKYLSNIKVELFNSYGYNIEAPHQIIFETNNYGLLKIDFSENDNGIYFVKLTSGNNFQIMPIIISK